MRPGTNVSVSAAVPPLTAPTDTGKAFVVIKTTSGTAGGPPVKVLSTADHESKFGARGTTEIMLGYDTVDYLFREPGRKGDVYIIKRGASETVADALARIPATFGPGQIIVPTAIAGTDTATNAAAIGAHCDTFNRIGLISGPKVATASDWTAIMTALNTDANARYLAPFAPWDVIPGLTAGTRDAPHTAKVAADIMRLDATGNPNVPAAGEEGRFGYGLEVSAPFTDAEITSLTALGLNCSRMDYDGYRTYGWRTAAPGTPWELLSNARLAMAIRAKAEVIAAKYLFKQLDARGHTIADFNAALTAMLMGFYGAPIDALYGETPQDAFAVNTGAAVNTPATIAAGELRAVISVRMSPFAELVDIQIVKRPITEEA